MEDGRGLCGRDPDAPRLEGPAGRFRLVVPLSSRSRQVERSTPLERSIERSQHGKVYSPVRQLLCASKRRIHDTTARGVSRDDSAGDAFPLYDVDRRSLRFEYPLTGRLDLQIFPNGMVRGYYHTSYYKIYIPVTGGRDGDYLWFDIGPSTVDLGLGAGPGASCTSSRR